MGYHSFRSGYISGFVIFDFVIQLLSILGNLLILLAVAKVKIGLAGYRRFLASLLANNLVLSLTHVLIAGYVEWNSADDEERTYGCLGTFLGSFQLFAVFAVLFNLCGMSIDHLIGIIYPIKYEYLMNTKLAKAAPYVIWIVAFLFGSVDILAAGIVYFRDYYKPSNAGAVYVSAFKVLVNSSSSPEFFSNDKSSSDERNRQSFLNDTTINCSSSSSSLVPPEVVSLHEIDEELLRRIQEDNDWCLVSYSYKLEWVQWMRLICTLFAFSFLLICYGVTFSQICQTKGNILLMATLPAPAPDSRRRFSVVWMDSVSAAAAATAAADHHRPRRQSFSTKGRSSRKFLMVSILLLCVFAICWLPFIVFESTISFRLFTVTPIDLEADLRLHIVQHIFYSLFLTYPLLDAVICATRVPAIRRYICHIFQNQHKNDDLSPKERRKGFTLTNNNMPNSNNNMAQTVNEPLLQSPQILLSDLCYVKSSDNNSEMTASTRFSIATTITAEESSRSHQPINSTSSTQDGDQSEIYQIS